MVCRIVFFVGGQFRLVSHALVLWESRDSSNAVRRWFIAQARGTEHAVQIDFCAGWS
jgi:hypothetical protein